MVLVTAVLQASLHTRQGRLRWRRWCCDGDISVGGNVLLTAILENGLGARVGRPSWCFGSVSWGHHPCVGCPVNVIHVGGVHLSYNPFESFRACLTWLETVLSELLKI